MAKKKVSICVPSYDDVKADFWLSSLPLYARGTQTYVMSIFNVRSCNLPESRYRLVLTAREKAKADYILWIDSDMTFPPDALDRLMAHDKMIAGASYVGRREPHELFGKIDPDFPNGVTSGLIRRRRMPTGFLLTRMDVFDLVPEPWFHATWRPEAKAFETDDYGFARVANEAGVDEMWMDLDLSKEMGHIGQQVFAWAPDHAADSDDVGDIYTHIQGWFGPEGEALYRTAVEIYPSGARFAEVGTWKGRSAAYMAGRIAKSGKKIKFQTIDHFLGSAEHTADPAILEKTLYHQAATNLQPLKEWVEIVRLPSVVAARDIPNSSIDFLFIDGSHERADVAADIRAWAPKLSKRAVIAGDDIAWPGVRDGVHDVMSEVTQVGRCWLAAMSPDMGTRFGEELTNQIMLGKAA